MLFLNVRFLEEDISGVGRFSMEVTRRLAKIFPEAKLIAPDSIKVPEGWTILKKGKGKGAIWEQLQAPFLFLNKGNWWFNPGNTCSLLIRNNITCIHDIIPLTNPEWYSFQARYYYKFLLPLVIKRSKCIITVSDFTKQDIIRETGVPADKIYVVPNAVDSFWQPVIDKPVYENYILTVASFDPRKNLKRLIEAFKLLKDKSLKLIIVGHKHKAFASQELELTEEDVQRIIFTGYLNDNQVRSLYSFAKVFVYPSLKEGFGIPPLEAMACGCPVVASNTSSIPEVCGEAVIYIDPLKTESIKSGIETVLADQSLANSLIEKGKMQAKSFSWDTTTNEIAVIIKNITTPKLRNLDQTNRFY